MWSLYTERSHKWYLDMDGSFVSIDTVWKINVWPNAAFPPYYAMGSLMIVGKNSQTRFCAQATGVKLTLSASCLRCEGALCSATLGNVTVRNPEQCQGWGMPQIDRRSSHMIKEHTQCSNRPHGPNSPWQSHHFSPKCISFFLVVFVQLPHKCFSAIYPNYWMPGLGGIIYRERLVRLGIVFSGMPEVVGDQVEVNKIMRTIDRVESQNLFPWKIQILEGIVLEWNSQCLNEICGAYFLHRE